MFPALGRSLTSAAVLVVCALAASGCGNGKAASSPSTTVPSAIQDILSQPRYKSAAWGLRVVDTNSGELVYDLNSDRQYLIGSVRKLFSTGLAMKALGPDHVFRTPVHRQGNVDAQGVLTGNLILVASGDMAMGGRTLPDGSYAMSAFDHNEANSLGFATVTTPDPLAGYKSLATQVAAAGIKRVTGEVVIDDRLFQPFDFRGELDVRPIFVNDNVVDVIATPGAAGTPATVDWLPKSAAFEVRADVASTAAGSAFGLELSPDLPTCIGSSPCIGTITGTIPVDYLPPVVNAFPVVRTFRITQPANYARTVFIEALKQAGVTVDAPVVAVNPVAVLPARDSYGAATQVAELASQPYVDNARHILKLSYNIGADTSLMLYGLTLGSDTLAGTLAAESKVLANEFAIAPGDVHFIDGSGGDDTTASNQAIIQWLLAMHKTPFADLFEDALPSLGVDGSLSSVAKFKADPTLAGATGQVHAKTGTYATGDASGPVLRAQAFGGYITAKSGRHLAYQLVVNDVGAIASILDVVAVFEDEGMISAMLWRDL